MRYRIMAIALIAMVITTGFQIYLVSAAETLGLAVFPGAEGFGTDTAAGRGGHIIRVTTLADSGPGSLREAVSAEGPRVIIFEVGGTIWTDRVLDIANPYVTIAGQTAPSPGITLAGAGLRIRTHDVLMQHIRSRVGDSSWGPSPDARDSLDILGSTSGSGEAYNIVIDHCSLSWAVDENMSTWYDNIHDITFRHCIMSEGLWNSIHPKGAHSMGLIIGDHAKNVAIIGCLFAHNDRRNPVVKGNTSTLIVNNVTYNYWSGAIHIQDPENSGPVVASVVGNVIIPGLDTPEWSRPIDIWYMPSGTQIYLSDNEYDGEVPSDPWSIVRVGDSTPVRVDETPIWVDPLTVRPSSEVQEWVLANAGARPWDRDAVDERIIADVQNGTGHIIDSQYEVGGWPLDAQGPTYHELTLPDNLNGDDDNDGYTNLEEWLLGFGQLPPTVPVQVFLPFVSK